MHRGFLLPLLITAPMLCPAGEGPSGRGPLQLTLKRAVELAPFPRRQHLYPAFRREPASGKARSNEVRPILLPDIEAQARKPAP